MRRDVLVLGGILLVALALRVARLEATDLWLDEACSVHYATLPWGELWRAFDAEIHPPLYYLSLRAWMVPFGAGVAAVRSFSLVASLLALVLTWRVGRRLAGPLAGAVAAAVLALSPLGIYYGVEARPYAPATLVVVAAVDRWLAWQDHRRRRDAVLYALLVAVAPYVHYFTLFVLPLVPLAAWAAQPGRRRADVALAVLPLLAFVPWLLRFGMAHAAADSKAWIGLWWTRYGALGSVGRSMTALGGASEYPPYLGVLAVATRGAPFVVAGTVAFAALLAVGVVAQARRGARAVLPLLAWLLAPVAVPVAVSLAGLPVFIPGRYEAFALPAAALLVGAGATAGAGLRWRWVPWGVGLVWAVLVVRTVAVYLGAEVLRPVRLVHGLLEREGQGVGEVLAVGFAYAPVRAADLAAPSGVPVRPVPASLGAHPGWEHTARPVEAEDLPAPLGRPGDVWLLTQEGDGFERWAAGEEARLVAAGLGVTRALAVGDLRLKVFGDPATGKALPGRGR